MSNLLRTYAGKVSQYHSDGSGRDFYILKNNGGLYRHEMVSHLRPAAGSDLFPAITTRNIRKATYNSNGSGRDTYINSSGNSPTDFYKSLRYQSPPVMVDPKDPHIQVHARWLRSRLKRHSFNHHNLTQRLSLPKAY